MGARQQPDFRDDRTHRRQVAPVDAAAMIEDVPAHDLGLGAVESLGYRRGGELMWPPSGSRAALTFALTALTAA